MKKNYKKETYKTKEEWRSNRGIGASDAAAIVGESKWLTIDDIYNKLVNKKEKNVKENELMEKGTKAEQHIRELFALDNPQYKLTSPPKNKYWLYRDKEQNLLTCTPDGLLSGNGLKLGLEIKYVDLIKKEDKEMWESNVLPNQYYFQLLHSLSIMNDYDGWILDAHLKYYIHNDETNKWEFSYAVDKPYLLLREEIPQHIEYLRKKEIHFIKNNVEPRKRPTLKIKL